MHSAVSVIKADQGDSWDGSGWGSVIAVSPMPDITLGNNLVGRK